MRALAEIQADGLRAASDLLERMLDSERGRGAGRPRSPDREYAALVDAWSDLFRRLAGGLERSEGADSVTVRVQEGTAEAPVRVAFAAGASESSVAEVWLHNGTGAEVGPLTLRCGPLAAAGGDVLDAAVRLDPAELGGLPPRSSRGVLLSLVSAAPPRPGVYRGVIQADGAPRLWLGVEVAVEPC